MGRGVADGDLGDCAERRSVDARYRKREILAGAGEKACHAGR